MYKKVLVPISAQDRGHRSLKSLDKAVGLCNGEIILLHVTEPVPTVVGGEAREAVLEQNKQAGLAVLAPSIEKLVAEKVPFHTRVVGGTPADTIIKIANEEQVELIVMYTDGRDGLDDMLLGSITERVLRHTTIDLLAVRV